MNINEAIESFLKKNKLHTLDDADINESDIADWLSFFDPGDQEVFLTLLSQYDYITRDHMEAILLVYLKLFEQTQIILSEILFVTVKSRHAYSGGSDIICASVRHVAKKRLTKDNIVNNFTMLEKDRLSRYKTIIFIDDISGSGITLHNEIQAFLNRFGSCVGMKKYILTIIATKKGNQYLTRKFRNQIEVINTSITLDAFKKTYLGHTDLDKMKAIVEKYEQKIVDLTGDDRHYLGFSKCKMLVSFEYDTPNNTLSTFCQRVAGVYPIFPRSEVDISRLTREEMALKSKINNEFAYLAAKSRYTQAKENG